MAKSRQEFVGWYRDHIGTRALERGRTGDDVGNLQSILNSRLPETVKLHCNGEFCAETEAAVRALQEGLGLKVDGVVGRKTWAALGL